MIFSLIDLLILFIPYDLAIPTNNISILGITIASKFQINSLLAVNEIVLTQPFELDQVVGVTGLVLTKLDGSARGGCVVFSSFLFISMIFYNSL